MDEMLTLLYCSDTNEVPADFAERWHKRGIALRTRQQIFNGNQGINGIMIDQGIEPIEAMNWITSNQSLAKTKPMLILLEGKDITQGLADHLQSKLEPDQFEVLRLLLLPDGQRAVLGGNGLSNSVHFLKGKLIEEEIITLICRSIEVDEVAACLPLYLEWKFRFYTFLGERCDKSGARLDVVSLGLGMDKRIGQGWFPVENKPVDVEVKPIEKVQWIKRELSLLLENTNISRIAIWTGDQTLPYAVSLFQTFPVFIYVVGSTENPNNVPDSWQTYSDPQSALDQADVLVILENDDKIKGIGPEVLVQKMRQTRILDACSCYPLQEMEAFQIAYRTFGQKTNVWNETAYNGV